MGRVKNTLGAMALVGALSASGCDLTTQQNTVVFQEIENGRNLRIMPIVSDKNNWSSKQKHVRAKVEEVVNSGEYPVVSVGTSYTDSYLTSAEIQYYVNEGCSDKNLRVIFLHSDKNNWSDKQKQIKPRLEEIVNSGKYDIQDISTVRLEGYLVAAEVYYRKN